MAKNDRGPVLRQLVRSVNEAAESAARLPAGDGGDGLWRIRLHEVDAWTLHTMDGAAGQQDDKGPFARLLSGA